MFALVLIFVSLTSVLVLAVGGGAGFTTSPGRALQHSRDAGQDLLIAADCTVFPWWV